MSEEIYKSEEPTTRQFKPWHLHLLSSIFLLVSFNATFWQEINKIVKPNDWQGCYLLVSVFLVLLFIINLLLSLICSKYSYKIFYPIIFMASAISLYFISQYNVIIDRDMIQNIVETNPAEAMDFLNVSMFLYLIFLGITPAFIVYKTNVIFSHYKSEFWIKIKVLVVSLISIVFLLYISYPAYASIARENRHLSHLIIPTNFIFAGLSYINQQAKGSNIPFAHISKGAQLGDSWKNITKKTVLVLVIGETARADHFGINGYDKKTTPKLAKRNIINFKNSSSCGTSTAISLPCMFSHLDRESFSKNKAKSNENLLDFLLNTGFSVQWRDNNTGCKGICNRVDFLDLSEAKDNQYCQTNECFDEVLLNNLSLQITNNPKNQVIILHQKGSHGPGYHLRYPKEFTKFTPVCTTNELQKCSQIEITNAYDNTIYYTDTVLDKIIDTLDQLPENYATSMLYFSDHGESLGEHNIYLHGAPYFMAPTSQTHVPFFIWLSDHFSDEFRIDENCLKEKQDDPASQDNLFHSVLGLMNIESNYYDTQKDIFQPCRL